MRKESGFTVIELLVAATLLIVIMGVVGSLVVANTRAFEANKEVTLTEGQLRSAMASLEYDVSMAGYCDAVDEDCGVSDALRVVVSTDDGARHVTSLALEYVEDRYVSTPVLKKITYEVADGKLLRQEDGADTLTVADGVIRLIFLGYRSGDDPTPQLRYARPGEGKLVGLDLRLAYLRGGAELTDDVTITLRNAL